MQQKPALYKAHVGVAWIFDILKGGRKKYPATNNNAVKIKALINLLLSFIGLSILKNNNDNTIPLNVRDVCIALPLCAWVHCSQLISFSESVWLAINTAIQTAIIKQMPNTFPLNNW